MLKGKYNKIICLRNSTPVPATQEVAALSGRELDAQSWGHCEFNVHYSNFAAWSPSFPGEQFLNLLSASCALVTSVILLGQGQGVPVRHGMGNFSLHLLCLLPKLPAFHSISASQEGLQSKKSPWTGLPREH